MRPEARKLLSDAHDCTGRIVEFTTGRTLADLETDAMLRSAVYWQFAIIGEALTKLRAVEPALLQRISESARIIGFRNQIIHGYEVIQDNITWQIIQDKLPVLRRELEALLAE